MRHFIEDIRSTEAALGSGIKTPSESEQANIAGMRRSIVVRESLPAGTTISRDMLAFKRPGTGIPPGRLGDMVGKVLTRDVAADHLISWDDLDDTNGS
jgi:N-acetylneuraminate synthase/N,N'-diacetyllegionaminate synthase